MGKVTGPQQNQCQREWWSPPGWEGLNEGSVP